MIDVSCTRPPFNLAREQNRLNQACNRIPRCVDDAWTRGCLQKVLCRNVSIRCGGPGCDPNTCGRADIIGGGNVITICQVGNPLCPELPSLLVHEAVHLCYRWAKGNPPAWDRRASEEIATGCELACYPIRCHLQVPLPPHRRCDVTG